MGGSLKIVVCPDSFLTVYVLECCWMFVKVPNIVLAAVQVPKCGNIAVQVADNGLKPM